MRAVVVHELDDIESVRLEEWPDPEVGVGSVLVEIHAAPLNYVDMVTFRNEYQFSPTAPYVPGKGPAGVVRSVGPGVTSVRPGDRVLAMAESGGYAELVAVDHMQIHPIPDAMSYVDAAAMSLAYDTAWMALRDRARLAVGESVLVLGASGAVGQATVQLATLMGASRVLAGISRPGRPTGPADAAIDLSRADLRNSLREQVYDSTDGRGVDVVIDTLGGDAFDGAVRTLAWRGRLVIVGFASGRIPTLKMNYPMLKNIEVSGLQISDYRKQMPELVQEGYQEIFRFYADGALVPPACEMVPLSAWREAFEALGTSRGHTRRVLVP